MPGKRQDMVVHRVQKPPTFSRANRAIFKVKEYLNFSLDEPSVDTSNPGKYMISG